MLRCTGGSYSQRYPHPANLSGGCGPPHTRHDPGLDGSGSLPKDIGAFDISPLSFSLFLPISPLSFMQWERQYENSRVHTFSLQP